MQHALKQRSFGADGWPKRQGRRKPKRRI